MRETLMLLRRSILPIRDGVRTLSIHDWCISEWHAIFLRLAQWVP